VVWAGGAFVAGPKPADDGTYLVVWNGHGDAVEHLRIDLLTESGWHIVDRHARKLGGARIVDIVAVRETGGVC
jgi:hypothetical protein